MISDFTIKVFIKSLTWNLKHKSLNDCIISIFKKTPITALRSPQKWLLRQCSAHIAFTKSKLPFLVFFAVAQEKVRKPCSWRFRRRNCKIEEFS